MSKCGVGLGDRVSSWLAHDEGARWSTEYPWTDITVEHLATHTSGICDYGNSSAACQDENPGWQRAFDIANGGGDRARVPRRCLYHRPGAVRAEQRAGAASGKHLRVQQCGACAVELRGPESLRPRVWPTSSTCISSSPAWARPSARRSSRRMKASNSTRAPESALWNGLDGAAVLRLAGRLGIWENRNVEPVRYWHEVTKIEGQHPGGGVRQSRRDLREQLDGHLDPVPGPQAAVAGDVRPRRQLQHGVPQRSADQHDRRSAGREQRDGRVVSHDQRVRAGLDRDGAELYGRAPTGATTGTWPAASSALPGSDPEYGCRAAAGGVLLSAAILPNDAAGGPAGG